MVNLWFYMDNTTTTNKKPAAALILRFPALFPQLFRQLWVLVILGESVE